MKKLMLLIIITTLSLTVFSQKDTVVPTKCIPVPILKLIAKDLISGDQAKVELKLTTTQLDEVENKISIKDSIISKLTGEGKNYLNVIDNQRYAYGILEEHTKQVETMFKKEKKKNSFNKVLSFIVIITLTYFLIIK